MSITPEQKKLQERYMDELREKIIYNSFPKIQFNEYQLCKEKEKRTT